MSVDLANLAIRVDSDGYVRATKRMREFERSTKGAETAAQKLSRQAAATGRQMQRVGSIMSVSLTAPLLLLGKATVSLGAEFDKTMSNMVTLVGLTRDEMQAFRKDILALAPTVGRGPVELANAMFAITSAGQRGAQAMDTLTAAAKASAIGLGNTRDIALTAVAAVTAYGEENLNAAQATEILIGTVEQGNLEASALSGSLGKVIGLAAQVGASFEDVGAFIAAFTRQGVKAAEAVTGLRGVLSVLTREPTAEAIEAFKQMDTTIEAFRLQIQNEGFIVAFQDLVNRADAAGVSMARFIPEVEALVGSLAVFKSEGQSASEIALAIGDAVGTMEERFAEMQALNPQFAFEQMKAETQALFIELSRDLLPAVIEISKEIRALAQWFRELHPETQTMVVRTLALTAALGPLLIVLGSLVRVLGTLLPLLVRLGILLGPTGLIVTGLGLVLIGVKKIADLINQEFKPGIIDATNETNAFNEALERLQKTAGRDVSSLDAANAQIEAAVSVQEGLLNRIENVREMMNDADVLATPGISKVLARELEGLVEQFREVEAEITRIEGLRQQYIADSDAAAASFDREAEALGDVAESAGKAAAAFDKEAFAELERSLDSSIEAMEEFVAARKLLEQARGSIGEEEFQRLLDILLKSDLAMEAFARSIGELERVNPQVLAELQESFAFLEDLENLENEFNGLLRVLDPVAAHLQDVADARELLNEAFEADLIDADQFERLSEAIEHMGDSMVSAADRFRDSTHLLAFAFDSLARSAEEGSQSQRTFAIAAEVANAVLAIQAVLNQGSGDPYSAFARMAAMAAIVASLGQNVGSLASGGGGFANLSQDRQAMQGTGSVLGDTEAKTESILKATKITADATSELVGINRGMLHALQSLQSGIEGAIVQIARGGDADFGALPDVSFESLLGIFHDPIGSLGDFLGLEDFLGGSADIVDEGIAILGGAIDEIIIQAFQSVAVKKHIFDDTDLEEQFVDLGDSVNAQFQLVFDSIVDTVREAAIAIGIPLDDIEARIASFEVASQQISLMDLSADEQREELLAVFGRIFDDLASHVIPFIDQFQQVGEGLGETLVRVATSIQVFEEAVLQLGFAADMSDPEAVAQMAVGLVDLAGGVSEFISQFSTFMDKFASDEQKLVFATDQLNRAFEQAGLVVPETAAGMWELMQSMDATTEEGREQIATILRLSGVASDYYDLIEAAETDRLRQAEIAAQLARDQLQTMTAFIGTGPSSALRDLVNRFEEAMDAARSLGASTREYAMILRSFDRQLQRMAAELTLRIISLTQQLFGSQVQDGIVQPIAAGVEQTREIANSLFTDWQRALSSLREFTQSILLNEELSTLTPAERLAEAQAQFDALLQAALGGDVEAAEALPDAARELLDVARFMFASGQQYQDIFDMVLDALNSVTMPSNIPEFITEPIGGGGGAVPLPPTALDLMAQALGRVLLAMDLAEALRDLALVLDTSVIQLAEDLGIPLGELVELLGVELGNLTSETATALASAAELLGADVFELAQAVGIGLEELAMVSGVELSNMSQALVTQLSSFADQLGVSILELSDQLGISVADMAETFGVSIDNFEAAHFQALVEFSDAMGLTLTETTDALGISLGEIADATSILSQSLDLAIAELPAAIQADLGPMLDAIRDATTQADANVAIQQLGNYVLGLPPDIAASLIPFLELIGFAEQTPELTALQQIEANTRAIVNAIAQIGNITVNIPNLPAVTEGGPNTNPSYHPTPGNGPGYLHGGHVEQTGMYQLHAGEAVINPTASNLVVVQSESDPFSRRTWSRIVNILQEMHDANRDYQQEDLQNSGQIVSGVREQAERTRRGRGCG